MPIFEFKCNDCKKIFEDLFSSTDTSKASCPHCKSLNVAKLLSSFAATNNSGDFACNNPTGCPSSSGCGGSCPMA